MKEHSLNQKKTISRANANQSFFQYKSEKEPFFKPKGSEDSFFSKGASFFPPPLNINSTPVQRKRNEDIPEELQTNMEDSLGQDFSNVNIQKNSQEADDLNARAFTRGDSIHFAPGEFNPYSDQGKNLIGHEFTHVTQQRNGVVMSTSIIQKGFHLNEDKELEIEADDHGKKAVKGEKNSKFKSSFLSTRNEPRTDQAKNQSLQKKNSSDSKPTKYEASNVIQRQEHLPRRPRISRPEVVSATYLGSFVMLRFNMTWTRDEAVSFLWPNGPRPDIMFFRPDETDPWKTEAGEYQRFLILPSSSVLQGILPDVHRMIYESIPEFNAQAELPNWVPDEIKARIQVAFSSEGNIHLVGRWPEQDDQYARGLYWMQRRGRRTQIQVAQLPDPSVVRDRQSREARITVNRYITSYVISEGLSISEAKTQTRHRLRRELVITLLEAIEVVIPARLPQVAVPRLRRPATTRPRQPSTRAPRARQPRPATSRLRQMIGDEAYEAHRQAIETIKRQHSHLASIPTDDLIALRIYTTRQFGRINLALRQADPAILAELQPFLERARAGLRQLPAYEGVAHATRSMTDEMLSAYRPGEIVEELAFTSASKPGTSAASREGNVAFTYQSKTGRDISSISTVPAEGEILFAPHTRFRVNSVERVGGARIIRMEEVP